MAVPSTSTPLPARVVLGSETGAPPLDARLIHMDAKHARVMLLAPPEAPPKLGDGATVWVDSERNLMVVGVVQQVSGSTLDIEVGRAGHREDRWSPRERGQLRFRFKPAAPELDTVAWARGGSDGPGAWTKVESAVELSLTGLAFMSEVVPAGTVLLSLVPPGGDMACRLVAHVLRVDPGTEPHTKAVVLEFIDVPPETGGALAETLLEFQDAALDEYGTYPSLDLPSPD